MSAANGRKMSMVADIKHNHESKDIKLPGECPACDIHHLALAAKNLLEKEAK